MKTCSTMKMMTSFLCRRKGVPALAAQSGFTLVEVMVAVAIVAVALPAVLFSVMQQIDGVAYLRNKTIAHWVALNQLEEARITNHTTGKLLRGRSTGKEDMAGQSWYWSIDAKKTDMKGFFRLEVEVRDVEGDEAEPLILMYGFIDEFHDALKKS